MRKIFLTFVTFLGSILTGALGIIIAPFGLIDGLRQHDATLFFGALFVCLFLGAVSFICWKIFQRLTKYEPTINGR